MWKLVVLREESLRKAMKELNHHYSQRHLKLFDNLSDKRTTDWGIDGYALSFNYVSDVFHVIKIRERKILKEATRRFTTAEYSVSSKTNRVGMVLDGPKSKHTMMICRLINQ